ncbi:MAG: hypothetical protein CMJ18_09710 [Phycisphaeraceae bacterium]|nr:hypothetical protein [Phycisphaeraceae bacterium]
MDPPHLQELLQELHKELEEGPAIDDRSRDLLLTVLSDIRSLVEKPPADAGPESHSIADRLREATVHLEQSHPRLMSAAEDLVEAISRIFR